MKIKYIRLLVLLFLCACALPENKKDLNSSERKIAICSIQDRVLPLIGEVEKIDIVGLGSFATRVDTGAKTTSVNAAEIKELVKNGEDYISFKVIANNGKSKTFVKKVEKISKIKSANNSHKRYFVTLDLYVEGKKVKALVNLNDRSRMDYKLLLGRNILRGRYSVDSSTKNLIAKRKKFKDVLDQKESDCNSIFNLKELGSLEKVTLDELVTLKARIDTGASRTSINAYDLKAFKKGKEEYISFKISNSKNKAVSITKKVAAKVPVTSATSLKPEMRYVVPFEVAIGNDKRNINVSLADRRGLKHKILIGRDYINNAYEVNTSKSYIYKSN
ncbi:RimK/LysX family protein [Halobacteriovorax sp. HLS]|uniref:putative ATP-dependent zinc protease n=1 Tax=Halobacteriovorax sp. HLS TaxID=2234000 RepID=UPI000FDAB5B9|nr:RimK/LysX family protein [Halobacteriovorax sp. HLS]